MHGLQVALDHVHAHAPSRNLGDLLRGGEARREDEHVDVRLTQGVVGTYQTLVAGFGQDGVAVEPAAVVSQFDDSAATLVIGGQANGALLGLARSAPLVGWLQPVVHGVADHVHQRVGQLLHHAAVHLGIAGSDGISADAAL